MKVKILKHTRISMGHIIMLLTGKTDDDITSSAVAYRVKKRRMSEFHKSKHIHG
jgi:hypothetical protein